MSKINFNGSFFCAIKGLIEGISKDRNTKIHLFTGILVVSLAIILKISRVEFMIIGIICFLVIALELLNNCVERLLDVLSPKYDDKIGKIKDIMAGMVLAIDFLAAVIGILIFYKPLLNALNINKIYPFITLILFNLILLLACIILFFKKKFNQKQSAHQQFYY